MRKIFFVSMVIGMCLVNAPAYCENLPESIKEMVLKDIGFYEPVEKTFISLLFVSTPTIASSYIQQDAEMRGIVKTGLWRDKFFIPNGYLRKSFQTRSERGEFNWNEYDQMWQGGVEDLIATEKLRPYLRKRQDEIIVVTLAKRVLKSIDYVNKWKLNGLDTWSFTFTYFYEPVLPDLPRLGPFTDKGTAMFNPATGKFVTVFEKDVGRQYGSSSFLGWNDATYTAWLENQPAPSKPKPSQLPGQAPIITETPGKITIDWLTKNIADTDYFVAQSKFFDVPFDIVWAAVNKYFAKTIATTDPNKGILITKQITNYAGDLKYQHFTLIEKISEESTKVTVKGFSYKYVQYQPPNQHLNGWAKDPVFPSELALSGIEKEIKREIKKQEKQGYFVGINGKQYYFVAVNGKQYRVGGDIFTGKKEGRVFKDKKGSVIRDPALAKKIAQTAWVYENIVKVPGVPASKRVSAILSTYKALRRYEVAQDILARASVQILAATISGGTTLTYTVPAGLTWRVVHDQFVNLKGLLSLTGRQGLEEALSKYQQMESLTAKLKPNQIDEATAAEIKRLYNSAYVLDLPYSALLTNLMPKKGRELVDKALKDIGDELVKTLPLPDAALTTREVLDLQGKMDDALKTDPAFKEYYEKLNLAKRLTEANEQVITVWAEQAVGYKE